MSFALRFERLEYRGALSRSVLAPNAHRDGSAESRKKRPRSVRRDTRSTRLEAQGRLINCFRSIIGCDKSYRLQVVAWLVSEEIERRHHPSLSLSLSLFFPLLLSYDQTRTVTHSCVRRVLYSLAKLEGKIEKLVPPRLTSPDLGANRSRMFPRKLGPMEAALGATKIDFFPPLVVIRRLSEDR